MNAGQPIGLLLSVTYGFITSTSTTSSSTSTTSTSTSTSTTTSSTSSSSSSTSSTSTSTIMWSPDIDLVDPTKFNSEVLPF